MEQFSFTHLRRDSGIYLVDDLELANIKHNDLKSVYSCNNKDVRKKLISLEKQFRLNYKECLKKLDCLETFLLARGFVHIMDHKDWISIIIKPTSKSIELNCFYPIFVKNIDNKYWIEISYFFSAEVTSDVDKVSKEHFRIYDAGGGSQFSLMWVGGTNIFNSNKIPNDLKLIDMLLDNYLNNWLTMGEGVL